MREQRLPAAVRRDRAERSKQAWEVARLFDAKATTWAAKYAPDGALVARLASLSAAVRHYAQAGDLVLDLGCGTGELAQGIATAGRRVVGCDISPQMLRAAADRGRCARWVRLAPAWRRLPFASASFDVVVAASVLEYAAEPVTVLRECARILRPGGVMVYTVPDLRHPVRWIEWLAQRPITIWRTPSGKGHRSRWNSYRAYLRASRQRHRVQWWLDTSWSAGLRPLPWTSDSGQGALRLLAFVHPGETLALSVDQAGNQQGARW